MRMHHMEDTILHTTNCSIMFNRAVELWNRRRRRHRRRRQVIVFIRISNQRRRRRQRRWRWLTTMISYHSSILTCLCHRWQDQHDGWIITQTTLINLHFFPRFLLVSFSVYFPKNTHTQGHVDHACVFVAACLLSLVLVLIRHSLNNRWIDTHLSFLLSVCVSCCSSSSNQRN